MSCCRYTPTPKEDRFQDLLEAICPDFLHTPLSKYNNYLCYSNKPQLLSAEVVLCMHKTTILSQFGLFCHKLTTISPSILNHFWWELYQDAMDLELTQIHEYKVFKDTGKAKFHNGKVVTPDGFQKIRVHFVYAVKHDGRFKARLVADGHLTKEPVESIYSGVVSLRSLRMEFSYLNSMISKSGEQMLEMHILKPTLMKSYASFLDQNSKNYRATF